MKCAALSAVISEISEIKNDGMERKRALFEELQNTVLREYADNGLEIDYGSVPALLIGAISIFGKSDPIKVVSLFEWLVDRKWIGFLHHQRGRTLVDLHGFSPVVAQFIIRYVFAHLDRYVDGDEECGLEVIVGKGKHTGGDAMMQRQDDRLTLKRIVQNELASWDPPLGCSTSEWNEGRIVVHREDMWAYLGVENNYAMRLLKEPSNEWYCHSSLPAQTEKVNDISQEKQEETQQRDTCQYCGKQYKRLSYLPKHESSCSKRPQK